MGYTWVLEQQLEQTSWVAVVLTLRYWGSQKNGWSPSVQERGQEAHQCFWVAAKMGETLWKSAVRKTEKQTTLCSVWLESHRKRSQLIKELARVMGPETPLYAQLTLDLPRRHKRNSKHLYQLADT